MARKKHHEEHENAERWLLTYADLITLLLGLFVILYAMSQVDAKKFQEVMQAFGRIFNGGAGVMSGQPGALEMPIPLETTGDDLGKQVQESIGEAIEQGGVSLSETSGGLTVHVTEKLLFDAGQSDLREEAKQVLSSLAKSLETMRNEIRVEGHTDDIPIASGRFPDNWHLSIARALNVGLYVLNHAQIKPQRLGIVGYGEFRPIAPNDTEQNRARNRRVDIVIVK
jgi:chemotaxis protein MotB